MRFMPHLRSQVASLVSAEEKSAIPIAFASYYAALHTYNIHRRATEWPVERAVVEGFERAIWVFKSVQSIAADSARLPFRLREDDQIVDDHPLYRVLNVQANPLESGKVFRKRLSAQVLLSKRGVFVEQTFSNGGTIKRFDLLPPDRTEIIPGTGADLIDHIRLTRRDGSYKNIDAEKVLWFRDPHPLDPYSGVTPLESAGMSVELDHFARLYNVSFMQNDGRPGGVLAVRKTDGSGGDIDPVQMDRLEEKFGKGPTEAGKLSVVAGDLSYVDLAARPRDMQYGATAKNAKIEVLSAFGVSESVLGYAAERTFDNADAELYNYWTRTMPNHNDILLDGFDGNSESSLEGFFDTSEIEVLERADRQRRQEAREEVAAGLRSIWSYVNLAQYAEEIDETPYTRALYVAQGKTPLPAKEEDAEALGLATPVQPGGQPPAQPPAPPGAEPGAEDAAAANGPAPAPAAPAAGGATPAPPNGAPPPPPPAGTAPAPAPAGAAPSGAARAALDALANGSKTAGGLDPKVRFGYRISAAAKSASESDPFEAESLPDLAAADTLEAAIAQALRGCAERWVERAAARVESPKQRKHTRHWTPEYDHDTRVGVKALDAVKAVDEQTWQAEAEQATHPLVHAAAVAAAVALLADLAVSPPPGLSMAGWAAQVVAQSVTETVNWVGRSAAFQASALIRTINIADQQGDSIREIARNVRDKVARMRVWSDGLATQGATATVNSARDAAAAEAARATSTEIVRVWWSRRDARVRETHARGTGADGQIRGLDEPFLVGTALLMRPGDVNGPLRETAGCRCHVRFRSLRSGQWATQPQRGEPEGKGTRLDEPRDADSDGLVYEGTPRERPATPRLTIRPVPGPPRSPIPVPVAGLDAVALGLPGRPDGAGTLDDPIDVQGDLDLAAQHMADGKHIRLNRVDEVGTLLDKLADLSRQAEAAGDTAPMFDLCLVSVPKTNLFCQQTKGIPRAKMPQLSGWPVPGSIAEQTLPKNRRGGVNGVPAFLDALAARNVRVTETDVRASWLKATQNQLNGAQVAKIAAGFRGGTYPDAPIFVTRDGYVIDGHHRWAAKVGIDTEDNRLGEVMMPVRVIDMEIGEALDFAGEFSATIGIQQEALGEGDTRRPTDLPTPQVRPDAKPVYTKPMDTPTAPPATKYRRVTGGYLASDGAYYVERQARMAGGNTNGWAIHERVAADRVGRDAPGGRPYDTRDGQALIQIGDDLYAHVGDEGSLGDAKAAVDSLRAREAAKPERNPDFGKRIGDPVKVPKVGGGFDILERVGGRKPGQAIERLLFRVERRDGVWGVYPPTEQSPALFSTGIKREAEQWAMDRANGIPYSE